MKPKVDSFLKLNKIDKKTDKSQFRDIIKNTWQGTPQNCQACQKQGMSEKLSLSGGALRKSYD